MLSKMSFTESQRTKTSSNDTIPYSTTPSYLAEAITGNDDLLVELLLLRLPTKSLLKFKSVSKHWLSLITNPEFSRRRNLFATAGAASGLFLKRSGSIGISPEFDFIDLNHTSNPSKSPFKSLTFVNDRSGIKILQSCNGLLLCTTSHAQEPRRNNYVYNPTTKQYTTLPRLPFRSNTSTTVRGLALAFDPSKSEDYRVVCVRSSDADLGQHQIEIYSSEAVPWRLSNVGSFSADFNVEFGGGVFWNGAVHWLSPWGTSLYYRVDEDRLCEMPMPPYPVGAEDFYRKFRYFGESREHLHLVNYVNEPGVTHFDVFEMEKDYGEWSLKFRVDVSEVSKAFPKMIPSFLPDPPNNLEDFDFSVLCVVGGYELDKDSYVVLKIPGKVLRYDFKSKALYKLCDIESSETFWEEPEAYQYIESLACV